MTSKETKGIDYVLNQSMTTDVNGIDSIQRLQGQTICLDNRSNTANSIRLKEKKKEAKKNRKYKWSSYSTRKYRLKNQQLKKGSFTYENLNPISQLWTEYASRLPETEQAVSKMDLHGAYITITASPDPGIVGLSGRIVRESYGALQIISEDNKLRQINKNHTVGHLVMPQGKTFEMNFTAMRCRPYLKSTKRVKQRTPLPLPF